MQRPEKFPCAQCGACCRHIDLIPQLAGFDRGDGVCIHLCGNLCRIYEDRPEICRVDAMYEKYFSGLYTRDAFYQLNLDVCRALMKNSFPGFLPDT